MGAVVGRPARLLSASRSWFREGLGIVMFQVFPGFGDATSARRAVRMGSYSRIGFGSIRFLGRLAQLVLTFGLLLVGFSVHADLPKPAYPVIFIHGLNSNSEDTWGELRRVLVANGWVDGGATEYEAGGTTLADRGTVKVWQGWRSSRKDLNSGSGPADFYAVNFSNNHKLKFSAQGYELGRIVKAVLQANPSKSKVILVGHSMGGLAARAYLQGKDTGFLHSTPFNGDVHALITIGTPHQGSMEAKKCVVPLTSDSTLLPSGASLLCNFKHYDSIGPMSLVPFSEGLSDLNTYQSDGKRLLLVNLPTSVAYTSIIVTWPPSKTLSNLVPREVATPMVGGYYVNAIKYDRIYGDEGDGVVTDKSQNLSTLSFVQPIRLQAKSVVFPTDLPPGCGHRLGVVNEVHSCEQNWPEIWDKLLRSVLDIPDTEPLIPMVSTGTVVRPKNFVDMQQTLIRGLVFHQTKSVRVTCRYGTDEALPSPLEGSNTTKDVQFAALDLPPFVPGQVHLVECVIPDSNRSTIGGNISTNEMTPIYFRLIASFDPVLVP